MPQNQTITTADYLKSRSPKLKDAFGKNGERLGLTTLYSVVEDGETVFRSFEECSARAYAESNLRIAPESEVMLIEEQVDILVCEARELSLTPTCEAR